MPRWQVTIDFSPLERGCQRGFGKEGYSVRVGMGGDRGRDVNVRSQDKTKREAQDNTSTSVDGMDGMDGLEWLYIYVLPSQIDLRLYLNRLKREEGKRGSASLTDTS